MIEIALFASCLFGIIFFHRYNLQIALLGVTVIVSYKLLTASFGYSDPYPWLHHIQEHGKLLFNIFALLLGFPIMAKLFENSNIIYKFGKKLPASWLGPFFLLVGVFVLSFFLDNIASAIIGIVIAKTLFRDKLKIGYLVAIVASSNAGGAGSVIGDTTSTILWLGGIHPFVIFKAIVPAISAFLFFSFFCSRAQQAYQPIIQDDNASHPIDFGYLYIVIACIVCIFSFNVAWHLELAGLGLWVALLIGNIFKNNDWSILRHSSKDAVFLSALIYTATLMPIENLPAPSLVTTFAIGYLSAFFDNIPVTVLALQQNIHDWPLLTYAVGFGGSMIWFGSSAGVALCSLYPEAKNTAKWLKEGWSVLVSYVIGFGVYLLIFGYNRVQNL